MKVYNGTDKKAAASIVAGNIRVDLGGGELGRGLYVGNLSYMAFNWAAIIHGKKNKAVVEFDINDQDLDNNNTVKNLNRQEATNKRSEIKRLNKTRIYLFNHDIIKAPIVGVDVDNFNQMTLESKKAENYINNNVTKKIYG